MKRFLFPISFMMAVVLFSQTVVAKELKFLMEPQFESIDFFFGSDFLKVKKDGKYGIVDFNGNVVAHPVFDLVSDFSEDTAIVKQDEKYGYINEKGQYLSQPKFDNVLHEISSYNPEEKLEYWYDGFSDGLISVKVDGKWGYANKKGEVVIKPIYREAEDFINGTACVKLNGKEGLVDTTGKYIVEPNYTSVKRIWDEDYKEVKLIAVYNGDRWGITNTLGEILIEPQFYMVESQFVDGRCYFSNEQGSGYLNEDGEMMLQTAYYFPGNEAFSEDMFPVYDGGYWGYMDMLGEMIIEPQYEYAEDFSEGLAVVALGDQFGFINTKGEMVIKPQYDDAQGFQNGRSIVEVEYQVGMIDANGTYIVEPQYDHIYNREGRLYVTGLDGQYGLIDQNGKVIAEPIYDYIYYDDYSEDGGFIVELHDQYGMIDTEGNMVLSLQDDEIFSIYGNGVVIMRNGDDLFYLLNVKTGMATKPLYYFVGPYDDKHYYAYKEDEMVFLNEGFSEFLQPEDEGENVLGGYDYDEDTEMYSLTDDNGTVIADNIEDMFYVSETVWAVQIDGLWGIVDITAQK